MNDATIDLCKIWCLLASQLRREFRVPTTWPAVLLLGLVVEQCWPCNCVCPRKPDHRWGRRRTLAGNFSGQYAESRTRVCQRARRRVLGRVANVSGAVNRDLYG